MSKLLFSLALLCALGACATSSEKQGNCTPQWPPGPCADSSQTPPKR